MNKLKNIFLQTILFCLTHYSIQAQSYDVPKTELLQYLYRTNSTINELTNLDPKKIIIPITEKNLNNHTHEIVKNKNGLFVLIDQTGRVYRATKESKSSITFTRIDSTHYWGYNGEAIEFSFHDTLFSFGGFGFWRINGQLRYYSKVFQEWNITPISNEYPTKDYINFYSESKSSLYYCQIPYHDPVTNKYNQQYSLYKLNLITKINDKIGDLSDPLISILKKDNVIYKINLPSMNGTLLFFSYENMLLLKFSENAVYKLVNKNIKDLILGNSNSDHIRNTFEINDSVYYTLSNENSDQLHSFEIKASDFVKLNYPIYIEQNEKNTTLFAVFILFTALSIIILFYVIRDKIKRRTKINYVLKEPDIRNINEFSEVEMSFINLIITNIKKGRYLTQDEINNALGVSKKTISNQKKVKGDTINKINHKFKILFDKKFEFIERERSEFDKRFYNYIINQDNIQLYSEKYNIK